MASEINFGATSGATTTVVSEIVIVDWSTIRKGA